MKINIEVMKYIQYQKNKNKQINLFHIENIIKY